MKVQIIPTIFAENKRDFKRRFEKALEFSDKIQIDFMDGKFVKSNSINLREMPDFKKYSGKRFEAHLMVYHPEKWIEELKKKGFKKIIFHYESVDEVEIIELIKEIRSLKMEVFIALNPETNISKINDFISRLDGILIMGVNPGKGGQKFLERTYQNIESLRGMNKKIDIEVDGGVNDKNIRKIFMSGANLINSGSFVYSSGNFKKIYNILNNNY